MLRERCGLRAGCRVLEIGPGPGLATLPVLDAGAHVHAIEPDPALAEHLRERAGEDAALDVTVAALEDAALAEHAYDLAIAATSFHWVEPDRGLAKIRDVLRPGGWFAMWWNVFGDPEQPDPFHEATLDLMGPLLDSPSAGVQGTPFALDAPARLADLGGAGFVDTAAERLTWSLLLTTEQVRALYATYSPVRRLPAPAQDELLDAVAGVVATRFGGRIERRMATALYTACAPSAAEETRGGD